MAYILPAVAGLVVRDGQVPHLDLWELYAVCHNVAVHVANLQVGRALHQAKPFLSTSPTSLYARILRTLEEAPWYNQEQASLPGLQISAR